MGDKQKGCYIGTLTVLFFGLQFFVYVITESLGFYAPSTHDEYGGVYNLFSILNAVPAGIICYLLEGHIAVFWKRQEKDYIKRHCKKESTVLFLLYIFTHGAFIFLHALAFSAFWAFVFAAIPISLFGICLALGIRFKKSPTED